MSDSVIDGNVDSGTQQQWISRNSEWGSWTGANWNMVFVGIKNPPAGEWPSPPYTKVAPTPIVREKPFLQVDAAGNYSVRVPALRTNSSGITWHAGSTPGKIHTHRQVLHRPPRRHSGHPQRSTGQRKEPPVHSRNLRPHEPIRVTRANTVVMGLGFATLRSINGTAAMTTADADGIIVAGLLFDAGPVNLPCWSRSARKEATPVTPKIPSPCTMSSSAWAAQAWGAPWSISEINSNDTIVDHTWIWRADHGTGVGWDQNLSANGLVVNGNNVTVYGLFVEHHQQFQVLWNGNAGRTYFYQSEIPYDPPDQASYTSAAGGRTAGPPTK